MSIIDPTTSYYKREQRRKERHLVPGTSNYYLNRKGVLTRLDTSEGYPVYTVIDSFEDVSNNGIPCWKLTLNGESTTITCKELLAITFHPNPKRYKKVRVKNTIEWDTEADNVEWCD